MSRISFELLEKLAANQGRRDSYKRRTESSRPSTVAGRGSMRAIVISRPFPRLRERYPSPASRRSTSAIHHRWDALRRTGGGARIPRQLNASMPQRCLNLPGGSCDDLSPTGKGSEDARPSTAAEVVSGNARPTEGFSANPVPAVVSIQQREIAPVSMSPLPGMAGGEPRANLAVVPLRRGVGCRHAARRYIWRRRHAGAAAPRGRSPLERSASSHSRTMRSRRPPTDWLARFAALCSSALVSAATRQL